MKILLTWIGMIIIAVFMPIIVICGYSVETELIKRPKTIK